MLSTLSKKLTSSLTSNLLRSVVPAASISSTPKNLGTRRRRKTPLVEIQPPPSAQEAVNNILYNTPVPSNAPVTRHVLNCLVTNEPGVLSRVSGILAGRGFNIDSLVVAKTEVPDLSRMTIVVKGQADSIEQCRRQVEDLVPVWAVLDYTNTKVIERELLLIKVSTIPPHVSEDLAGEESEANANKERVTMIIDISNESVLIQLSAKSERVDSFIKLLRPYGIIEASRSGMMAMPRTPVDGIYEEVEEEEEESAVDLSVLPPS
ncbi:acetolactate synthase [Neocallimastix californiae]|uniref:Acetolactate synthase n=1 Tax=Neocallimastix californiae TaxID=1754190 RepID=A0A1Y2FSB8_9FUNG|nr:acetolactate synthase [Neocallimastix californiae]|eukprot:ORY86477.1 acetolactate synthase [Neocallimastix californiae]